MSKGIEAAIIFSDKFRSMKKDFLEREQSLHYEQVRLERKNPSSTLSPESFWSFYFLLPSLLRQYNRYEIHNEENDQFFFRYLKDFTAWYVKKEDWYNTFTFSDSIRESCTQEQLLFMKSELLKLLNNYQVQASANVKPMDPRSAINEELIERAISDIDDYLIVLTGTKAEEKQLKQFVDVPNLLNQGNNARLFCLLFLKYSNIYARKNKLPSEEFYLSKKYLNIFAQCLKQRPDLNQDPEYKAAIELLSFRKISNFSRKQIAELFKAFQLANMPISSYECYFSVLTQHVNQTYRDLLASTNGIILEAGDSFEIHRNGRAAYEKAWWFTAKDLLEALDTVPAILLAKSKCALTYNRCLQIALTLAPENRQAQLVKPNNLTLKELLEVVNGSKVNTSSTLQPLFQQKEHILNIDRLIALIQNSKKKSSEIHFYVNKPIRTVLSTGSEPLKRIMLLVIQKLLAQDQSNRQFFDFNSLFFLYQNELLTEEEFFNLVKSNFSYLCQLLIHDSVCFEKFSSRFNVREDNICTDQLLASCSIEELNKQYLIALCKKNSNAQKIIIKIAAKFLSITTTVSQLSPLLAIDLYCHNNSLLTKEHFILAIKNYFNFDQAARISHFDFLKMQGLLLKMATDEEMDLQHLKDNLQKIQSLLFPEQLVSLENFSASDNLTVKEANQKQYSNAVTALIAALNSYNAAITPGWGLHKNVHLRNEEQKIEKAFVALIDIDDFIDTQVYLTELLKNKAVKHKEFLNVLLSRVELKISMIKADLSIVKGTIIKTVTIKENPAALLPTHLLSFERAERLQESIKMLSESNFEIHLPNKNSGMIVFKAGQLTFQDPSNKTYILYQVNIKKMKSNDWINILNQIDSLLNLQNPPIVFSAALKKYCEELLFHPSSASFVSAQYLDQLKNLYSACRFVPSQLDDDQYENLKRIMCQQKKIIKLQSSKENQFVDILAVQLNIAASSKAKPLTLTVFDKNNNQQNALLNHLYYKLDGVFSVNDSADSRQLWQAAAEYVLVKMQTEFLDENDVACFLNVMQTRVDENGLENDLCEVSKRTFAEYLRLLNIHDQKELKRKMLFKAVNIEFCCLKEMFNDKDLYGLPLLKELYELLRSEAHFVLLNMKTKGGDAINNLNNFLFAVIQFARQLPNFSNPNSAFSSSMANFFSANEPGNQKSPSLEALQLQKIFLDHFMCSSPDELISLLTRDKQQPPSLESARKYILNFNYRGLLNTFNRIFKFLTKGIEKIINCLFNKKPQHSFEVNHLVELLLAHKDTNFAVNFTREKLDNYAYRRDFIADPSSLMRLFFHFKDKKADTTQLETAILRSRFPWMRQNLLRSLVNHLSQHDAERQKLNQIAKNFMEALYKKVNLSEEHQRWLQQQPSDPVQASDKPTIDPVGLNIILHPSKQKTVSLMPPMVAETSLEKIVFH